MKLLLILLGLLVAGVIGYRSEPALRHALTGLQPGAPIPPAGAPDGSGSSPAIDPASLPADQLPEKVTVHTDVAVTDAAAEITMTIPAGSRVKLVSVDATHVVVSPGEGPYSGSVPIADTDLMEQLRASQQPAANSNEPPATDVPSDPTPADPTPNEPLPGDPPATITDTTATTEPATTTEPVSEPPATGPTTTDPASEPAATDTAATDTTSVVDVMQESLRNGQIKTFTLAQVLGWQAEPDETVDGESFRVGSCTYEWETSFGAKTVEAKALIKNGKVVRWIWTKTGKEIK